MPEDLTPYNKCYRCGFPIYDDYPSTLCVICRRDITQPVHKTLAERLNVDDIRWLRGVKIKITADMLTSANHAGLHD
jgi:hypothetical protein